MTDVQRLIGSEVKTLCEEEGFRDTVYHDHLGNPTIGHGIHTITELESKMIVRMRLMNNIGNLIESRPWLEERPVELVMILGHMSYQLGMSGLSQFINMWAALVNEDYDAAAHHMLDSKWHEQTPARAERLAERMRSLATQEEDPQ